MSLSLRVPSEKNEMLKKAAAKTGKTKSAYILEAVNEKLGLIKGREQMIRKLAGWLSHEEAKELRESVRVFNQVNQGDWD
jgi:predicted transcriptional regulator